MPCRLLSLPALLLLILAPGAVTGEGSVVTGAAYTAPVVALINGLPFSAGEFCAEMLKQLPNVTAVADTTGGGSVGGTEARGYRSPFRLPSGKWFDIGNLNIRPYDGLPWENLGIPPDIRVPQPEADLRAGHDRQLEAAIAWLQ